jgi:rhodanese-related sulfurtransferase
VIPCGFLRANNASVIQRAIIGLPYCRYRFKQCYLPTLPTLYCFLPSNKNPVSIKGENSMLKKLAMLMVLLCSAVMVQAQSAPANDSLNFEPIPQQTLLDYLAGKTNFTLIDARSVAEYEAGHIYGASNVPFDGDLSASPALPDDLNAAVVVYCKSGIRAAALQTSMLAMGYTNVRVLGPTQMLWADDLPVFNCGATATPPATLTSVDTLHTGGGN